VTTEPKSEEKSRAILIGVSAYEDAEFPSIRAARKSLTAVHRMMSDPKLCGWNPEDITVITNPHSASDLAVKVTNLARATDGVLMIYYVGHGILSRHGELCLTVTTTLSDHPKITGLPWSIVADALRESPARMRLAILDCCFAGQAIEALTGDANEVVANITHIDGVYTLTATTRNRTAHVPSGDIQDTASTSFTGELLELVTTGIPEGPADLTLGIIYAHLKTRLAARGLPLPNQRSTDLGVRFVFSKNVWVRPEIIAEVVDNSEHYKASAESRLSTEATARRKLAADAFYDIATDANLEASDRIDAADRLTTVNVGMAAECYYGVATDANLEADERIYAANQLAKVDIGMAAEAFHDVATDANLEITDRLEAAGRLADLNQEQGADAFFDVATDYSIDTQDRREAAEKLTALDEKRAAEAFSSITADEQGIVSLSWSAPFWFKIAVLVFVGLLLLAVPFAQLMHY